MANTIPVEIMDIVLDELKVGLTLVDNNGEIIYFNQLASELLGWDFGKLDNNILSCHKTDSKDKVIDKLNHASQKEWHRVIKIKERFIENTYSPVRIPGKFTGVMIVTKDVTGRENSIKKLKESAEIDLLTGLCNRNSFNDIIQKYMMRTEQYGVVMLDINGLKYINDHLGHEEGDRIITEAANVIKSSIRVSDLAFRIGGDEFIVLTSNEDASLRMIEKRVKEKNRIPTQQNPAVLNLSLGYATSTEGESADGIIALADQRMYEDKRKFYQNEGEFIKRS